MFINFSTFNHKKIMQNQFFIFFIYLLFATSLNIQAMNQNNENFVITTATDLFFSLTSKAPLFNYLSLFTHNVVTIELKNRSKTLVVDFSNYFSQCKCHEDCEHNIISFINYFTPEREIIDIQHLSKLIEIAQNFAPNVSQEKILASLNY